MSPSLRTRLEHLVDEVDCSECGGSRLRDDASAVRFRKQDDRPDLPHAAWRDCLTQVKRWKLDARDRKIAGELVREIKNRLTFLVDVGLEYLTLGRSAPTLSGGESQRIRLASQVGSGLCGVLYVLDEPTIGLHPRDNAAAHQCPAQTPRSGQHVARRRARPRVSSRVPTRLLDFGPRCRPHTAGRSLPRERPAAVAKRRKSVTGPYLSGKKAIAVPRKRRVGAKAESGERKERKRGRRQRDPARPVQSAIRIRNPQSRSSVRGTTI